MFSNCKDKKEAIELFRKIAMRLHPDCGGSLELMAHLQRAYDNSHVKSNEYLYEKVKTVEEQKNPQKYEYTDENIHSSDERSGIFHEMQQYADRNPSFNTKYLDSVFDAFEKTGYITGNQFNCLVKTYYSFKMFR